MTNDNLYANNPTERLEAAQKITDISVADKIKSIKSHYWFGSPNAWVVFLGISPGGSPPKGKEDISNYESEISFTETSAHLQSFDEKKFWNKIRIYIKALFPTMPDKDLYKLVLMGNLINAQQGDSGKIIKSDTGELQKGVEESLEVLSMTKPKLLICLQKEVYQLVYNTVTMNKQSMVEKESSLTVHSGIKNNTIYKVPVTCLQSVDALWNKWVLTRMPMHPSRSPFYKEENLVNEFLKPIVTATKEFVG